MYEKYNESHSSKLAMNLTFVFRGNSPKTGSLLFSSGISANEVLSRDSGCVPPFAVSLLLFSDAGASSFSSLTILGLDNTFPLSTKI